MSQRGSFRKDAPSYHDPGSGSLPLLKESMMRFYDQTHKFYCGIDLHARLLAICIFDQAGNIVLQTQIPAEKLGLMGRRHGDRGL